MIALRIRRCVAPSCTTMLMLLTVAHQVHAQRQMERLNRGVVAVPTEDGDVFVGWRLLADDPECVAFNVYRSIAGERPVRLNAAPLAGPTFYTDTTGAADQPVHYSVHAVVDGRERAVSGSFAFGLDPFRPYHGPSRGTR